MIHLLTYYRSKYSYKRGMFPVAERIGDSTISLPVYPRLTDEEIERVIDTVKEVVAGKT
jgi:dTDP-4-amino-4,6-dideoxygalactose transaminase